MEADGVYNEKSLNYASKWGLYSRVVKATASKSDTPGSRPSNRRSFDYGKTNC